MKYAANAALGEAARKEREKRFCKTLNEDQLKAIIDGQGIDGATIGEWFSGWQRDDLERISRAVQKATVEQLTVSDIAKQIRGTKENDYNDGILATTRVGAVRLARTVINGVCNNARVETIKANSDAIDGIKFVGTLDGKTCPHCASYDGHIWRGEDMASARRPPIHPNCRCTLVPYVELTDEEGNVVDIDNERPAANADFDQLAKDAYDQKAKKNGWKRRFEDLSPSTRLKYYYQAQKDYERETGKPAYRQVDSNLSFPEYFKQQPDSFKRSWLGAKRYDAYKAGKLTEKTIFSPDLSYTVSPTSLVKFVEPDVPETLEELVKEYEKKGPFLFDNPAAEYDENNHTSKKIGSEKTDSASRDAAPEEADIFDIDNIAKRLESDENIAKAEETHRQDVLEIEEKYKALIAELPDDLSQADRAFEIRILDGEKSRELAEAEERFCSAYWDIILPVNDPKSKNRRKANEIWKKSYDKTDTSIYAQGAREGLQFVARLCDNFGITFGDVDKLTFSKELARHSFYSEALNEIYFERKNMVRGADGTKKTAIHETAHAIERKTKEGKFGDKLLKLLDKISQRDEKGEYLLVDYNGSNVRISTVQAPDLYALKDCKNVNGETIGVEILSTFFQQVYVAPWLLQEKKYREYYQEVLNCIKATFVN